MKEIIKEWGVVYSDGKIQAIKTPDNEVYPSSLAEVKEFDSEEEMNQFIIDNELEEAE